MRSVMAHQFSQVPRAQIPRSSFNRSCGWKGTFNSGFLVPVFVDEVLPGDTFNVRMNAFARMATPINPIMDNLFLETFFFFIPTRLVWDNWQKFNGEQDNPGDSTDFTVPETTNSTFPDENSLYDYMGIPTKWTTAGRINVLPFRCYNLVFNEWFRDQNLQNSLSVPKDDGPESIGGYVLQRRGKRHDYFTSCLPWPQKGESVSLPLAGLAELTTTAPNGTDLSMNQQGANQARIGTSATFGTAQQTSTNPVNMFADMSTTTAATINSLRQAFQIQKLLERDARGGTRYTEIIRAHFGVTSPDARLQRPEYLGGGSQMVNIQSVPQTSETQTGGNTPQGNLAAYGTVGVNGHGFTKSFTEHGYVLGIVNVRADLTYQYGLDRMWSRRTRYDFYWPALSHIGEQAVLQKEIYADGSAGDDNVFGYQERYAEYRYKPSKVTGRFRSNSSQSLDVWHLSEKYSAAPVLNADWIQSIPPVDRVIAIPSEPEFIMDAHFSMRCARPMPLYGVPGLIDHF